MGELKHLTNQDAYRRTWELELIISGAVIVALFQIPSLIDHAFMSVEVHLSREFWLGPYLLFYTGKLALFALIIVFLGLFFLRSFWVGLIGLESVAPTIDWDRLNMPLQKRFYERRGWSLSHLAQKVDSLCSSLFSVLFSVLIVLAWVLALIVVGLILAWVFKTVTGLDIGLDKLVFVTFYLLLGSMAVLAGYIGLVEKRIKKDPEYDAEHPKAVRRAEHLMKWMTYIYPNFLIGPIMLTFTSRSNRLTVNLVAGVTMIMLISLFLVSFFLQLKIVSLGSYIYFPQRPNALTVNPDLYDDQRVDGSFAYLPSIQSDVVDETYLRLFIPFRARHENEVIEERCPELVPFSRDGLSWRWRGKDGDPEREQQALECLSQLYEVTLNEERLETLDYHFYTHPRTRVRGLIAHIDVSELSSGRHLLTVVAPRPKDSKKDPYHYYMPFWRP